MVLAFDVLSAELSILSRYYDLMFERSTWGFISEFRSGIYLHLTESITV